MVCFPAHTKLTAILANQLSIYVAETLTNNRTRPTYTLINVLAHNTWTNTGNITDLTASLSSSLLLWYNVSFAFFSCFFIQYIIKNEKNIYSNDDPNLNIPTGVPFIVYNGTASVIKLQSYACLSSSFRIVIAFPIVYVDIGSIENSMWTVLLLIFNNITININNITININNINY